MPLPAALIPVGAALKGLTGLGGAVKLSAKGGMAYAKGRFARRMAGKALADYMGPDGVTPTNLAVNFGFDAGFGAMAGLNNPGDLGDKLIAGTTSALGGALGGVGAVTALGKYKSNNALRMLGEFGGGYAGDMAGMMVGDAMMRAKGGGQTPYERLAEEQQRQLLAQYGVDPFMADNGLG